MEVQHQERGPSRKVYTLTEKGLAELRKWVHSAPELPQIRHPFLIQLAWADQLKPEELDDLLARYEEEVREQLAILRAQRRQKDIAPSGAPRDGYIKMSQARTTRETVLWGMIQENWISFYEHELKWVRRLRKTLTGSDGKWDADTCTSTQVQV